MACSHCLRGDAENVDMDRKLIEQIFSQTDHIGILIFSGGEPGLCPDSILFALECAKKYEVYVGYVYIVTNGKEVSDEFLHACREWHIYCMGCEYGTTGFWADFRMSKRIIDRLQTESDTTGCVVALSMDPYHEDIPVDNIIRLSSLPILKTDKYNEFIKDRGILDEGRARENGIGDPRIQRSYAYSEQASILTFDDISEDGMYAYVEELYINAEGGILKYCDYSYISQEDYILGRISDTWAEDLINRFGGQEESEDNHE